MILSISTALSDGLAANGCKRERFRATFTSSYELSTARQLEKLVLCVDMRFLGPHNSICKFTKNLVVRCRRKYHLRRLLICCALSDT